MAFSLVEVNDKKTAKEFLMLPVRLYRHEAGWIRPLDSDVEKVFDPKQNKSFRSGECIRWVLRENGGETVGRVAAFYDKKVAARSEQPTGGMGFFECINDREAAFRLFDACREWHAGKGMEAMDGPVNFGDRDRWWGLLVDGFSEPNYCMPWNFRYYKDLFEEYGFMNYFNQYTFRRPISIEGVNPIIMEKAERVYRNPDFSFRHISRKEMDKVAEDTRTVYNQAWAGFSGVKEISKAHVRAMLNSFKPIMDERLIYFAFHKDEPIGFYIMIPEFNQIVKHLNGRLDLPGKIKFLYHKWNKTCNKAYGVIFGVVPRFQGKGVEGGMIKAFADIGTQPGFQYKELELNWIGDFNPPMIKLANQLGFSVAKTHVTYRYLFDREKDFRRAKIRGREE